MILERRHQYVFGPVPSRRLGRSLGIDPVPFKTCSYDCIYCQLGRTTHQTVERGEYAPLADILDDLDRRLAIGPEPDYVTLSGSGEPTLYSPLRPLILGIKQRTDRPVAVLTNGSLLWDPEVQDALLEADLVIPSLDAGDDATFQWINRPHPAVSFERMVAGLKAFCRLSSKPIWLEVFLLRGANAQGAERESIVRLVERITPDRVQLNTATRPPCDESARPVQMKELNQIARAFAVRAEVIAERPIQHSDDYCAMYRADIVDILMRRPCTPEDLASGLGLHPNEVAKHLDELVRAHVLTYRKDGQRVYYRYAKRAGHERSGGKNAADHVLFRETRGE